VYCQYLPFSDNFVSTAHYFLLQIETALWDTGPSGPFFSVFWYLARAALTSRRRAGLIEHTEERVTADGDEARTPGMDAKRV
jgi:hypothetical protein